MAVLAASKCGLKLDKVLNQLNKIKSVPGRLECVSNLKNNSKIIVDFAHTPDALEQSLIELQKQFKKQILIVSPQSPDRGVRRSRFYVIRKTSMPAALVEIGFVTGMYDANLLIQKGYRDKISFAIARGILNYLKVSN